MFVRRKMDVLALSETKMKGIGEIDLGEVKGRISGVVSGRAREGVAIVLSEWMLNKVVEWKEVTSRLMWVRVRLGKECWVFVSAYGPGSERTEEERNEFWNDLTNCVEDLSRRNCVIVLGDLNARVGDREVEGVVGKFGVPGENVSGEKLLEMCGERELVIGNSMFRKKRINKYTWIRVANGEVVEKALMDYVLIEKRMISRLKDVHVFRGVAAGMSDHYLVEARVIVAKEWVSRMARCRREVVRVEELGKPEKKREYQERVKTAYERVKGSVAGELEEEWKRMRESLVENASVVCGKRSVGGGIRKGSEWWNEEVKMKVEEKKKAYEEWLQCRSREKYERYKEKNVAVKRHVAEAKRAANNRWGQKLSEEYEENKKKFWKELKRARKSE